VGHGAGDGDAVAAAGVEVGGGVEAGEVEGAGGLVGGVDAVGASGAEVDEGAALCGVDGAGAL
jgi:hypothetical protein